MAVFENPIVYSMIARDALIVLPLRWKKELDMSFVRDEERVALTRLPRVTKPMIPQVHPVLEEALLKPITQEVGPSSHHFTAPGSDELTTRIVESARTAIECWAGKSGSAQRFSSLGQLAHRVIDAENPFSMLDDSDQSNMLRERLASDLALHLPDLPFLWRLANSPDVRADVQLMPFESADGVRIHMGRRVELAVPIANGYLVGNGYPAIANEIGSWYNDIVNTIGKVWLNCVLR